MTAIPTGCEALRRLRFPKEYMGSSIRCGNWRRPTQIVETLLGNRMRVCKYCYKAMLRRSMIAKVIDS